MVIHYEPCPDCDGWLREAANIIKEGGMEGGPDAVKWACATCGRVEEREPQ